MVFIFGATGHRETDLLRVQEKYNTLLPYLNEGKKDQAVAYIVEANEKYLQYCTEAARIIYSLETIHFSLREKLKVCIGLELSSFPQFVKAYVDMRLDLYTFLIVSKTPSSVDKVIDALETYLDQCSKASLRLLRAYSEIFQMVLTVYPNYQPTAVQALADMLLPFQSADSNLGFFDQVTTVSSYVSRNQDMLSNAAASCINS